MDPNSALTIIRDHIGRCLPAPEPADAAWVRDAQAALEEVAALDEWLSNGGFTPHAWATHPATTAKERA